VNTGLSNSRENLEDHVEESQTKRAEAETIESIRRGVADADNGRVQSLSDMDGKIRSELGFPARDQ
jgi:hypothetical protein